MSIIYNGTVINQRLGVVVTNIDAGAGNGQMRLLSSASATVGLVQFNKPCGTVSGGVLTFSGLPLAAPLTLVSGQVTAADLEDSAGTVVASGLTVGNSTAYDIVMSSVIVSTGQIITLTYATITGS